MEWDDDVQIFHGNAANLRSVITFQGRTEAEAKQAFRDSVDDYLEWCAADVLAPELPAGDEIVLHMRPIWCAKPFLPLKKPG